MAHQLRRGRSEWRRCPASTSLRRKYLGFVESPVPADPPHPIRFHPTPLSGCFLVEPALSEDERGFFARTFCAEEFTRHGLALAVAQCSVSFNRAKGTLRGLHLQDAPHGETKLVRCSRGRIFDVAVDLRQGSPTFAQWTGAELSAAEHLALYIPEGLAHGFLTLEPNCEVTYQISTPFWPESARGIRWDDPDLAVDWPDVGPLTMSDRDRNLSPLSSRVET